MGVKLPPSPAHGQPAQAPQHSLEAQPPQQEHQQQQQQRQQRPVHVSEAIKSLAQALADANDGGRMVDQRVVEQLQQLQVVRVR